MLTRIVKKAYSIEIIEPLGRGVGKIFAPLGYTNVQSKVGDGYYGWPEVKDGFDVIIVTCAATFAPPELFKQMKPGGRMIIPIGQPFKRGQVLYVYTKDEDGKSRGFAIVLYKDAMKGQLAIETLTGRKILGREIVINEALKKGKKKPTADDARSEMSTFTVKVSLTFTVGEETSFSFGEGVLPPPPLFEVVNPWTM